MPQVEWYISIGLGAFFILLGIALLVVGRKEKRSYYDALVKKPDIREYVEHTPERPELTALQIGGIISIAAGVVLLAIGIAFKLLT